MNDHYSGNDAAKGCGLLLIAGSFALLVIAVVAALAIRDGLITLTASVLG